MNLDGICALLTDIHDVMCYFAWGCGIAVIVAIALVFLCVVAIGKRQGEELDEALAEYRAEAGGYVK
jgi:hypothetical protein